MPTISPEKVCFIVVKTREYQAKVEPEEMDEGSNPADDGVRAILEDYADDATFEELIGALEALNEDELNELMALAWLGRGDFETAEWNEAVAQAAERERDEVVRRLTSIPLLADFLEAGLAQFGQSCDEFELGRL